MDNVFYVIYLIVWLVVVMEHVLLVLLDIHFLMEYVLVVVVLDVPHVVDLYVQFVQIIIS